MKKAILFSLLIFAGGMQGVVWIETFDSFVLAVTMSSVCGFAIGCIGSWVITKVCDE